MFLSAPEAVKDARLQVERFLAEQHDAVAGPC